MHIRAPRSGARIHKGEKMKEVRLEDNVMVAWLDTETAVKVANIISVDDERYDEIYAKVYIALVAQQEANGRLAATSAAILRRHYQKELR